MSPKLAGQNGQKNAQPFSDLAIANANVFLRRMCNRGVATVSHFNSYLKATSRHSDSTRYVMENTMPANGVRPNMQTFFILVKQLIMEGDALSAKEVVESVMPQALGVSAEPLRQGKQVRKLKKQIEFWMSRTPADLSRMRTARMKSMLNEGGAQSYLNRSRVREFYERLVANGVADMFQWNQYLMALNTSDEIRAALEAQMQLADGEANLLEVTK